VHLVCADFQGASRRQRRKASGSAEDGLRTGWCNCVRRREARAQRRSRDGWACGSIRARSWRPAGAGATVLDVSESLRLTIVYEDGGDGWIVASIPEVPGAHSQGHTRQEARENVIDALQTMLTPDEELQEPADREALVFTAQP